MIYDFTLQTVGLVAGAFLVVMALAGLLMGDTFRSGAVTLPRSGPLGIALLALCLVWSFWLLATMEMGEFSSFRRPLLFVLPVGFILVVRFVNEFLAVRALGILCLLAAEPLLEAAFLRYENSRLLVTVFAYVLILAGLFWVTMPYLLRDQINWSVRSGTRWRILNAVALLYGAAILFCALTRY